MKCLLCKEDAHRHTCDTCLATMRRHLRWLELYTQWLHTTTMLEPTRGTTGRHQPGYGSRAPLRLEAIVMLDHRSRTDPVPVDEDRGLGLDNELDPAWSILGTLTGLALAVARHAGHTRNPRDATVSSEIGYLLGSLEWCAGQPWIDDLAADIAALHAQARALVHDVPRDLGECLTATCTGRVHWTITRDKSDRAKCVACGRPYTGLDLVRIGVNEEITSSSGQLLADTFLLIDPKPQESAIQHKRRSHSDGDDKR